MNSKRAIAYAVVLVVLGIIAIAKFNKGRAHKNTEIAKALESLTLISDYESKRSWYDAHGERAASLAFDTCVKKNPGDSGETYYEDRLVPAFFEKLIAMANDEGETKIAESIKQARIENSIPKPADFDQFSDVSQPD